MTTLNQNKNFKNRQIKISDSKFFYKESRYGNENEYEIPYEKLEGEKVSFKTSNFSILWISIVLYILSITIFIADLKGADVEAYAWLFWSVIATIVLVAFLASRENLWKIRLSENGQIFINKNIPNKDVVDNFIIKLYASRNAYLMETYSVIDENLNYENQLQNLKWLKSINVLSKNEFEIKYADLKNSVKRTKNKIGFEK